MNGIFSKGLRYALSEPGTKRLKGARHKIRHHTPPLDKPRQPTPQQPAPIPKSPPPIYQFLHPLHKIDK